jgi:hypothetical protein
MIIVFISTLFWTVQNNPTLEPIFFDNAGMLTCSTIPPKDDASTSSTSRFIGFDCAGTLIHWKKAFERSIVDLLLLLQLSSDFKVGLFDSTDSST